MDNFMSEATYLEQKQMHREMWSAERFRNFYGEEALPPVSSRKEAGKRLNDYLNEIKKHSGEGISLEEFLRLNSGK